MGLTNGVVTILKSTTLTRIKENSDIFNFQISAEDTKKIQQLNIGVRIGMNPNDVYRNLELIAD